MLRVGGAFLAANVWLNGRLLGSHYGYFAPFGFDITSFLAADNLLVICCESPIETDLTRKKHVMGIFNDGDSRPYPPSAYFSLPEPYRWEVPVGLWRGVELEYLGPVALDWLRLRPRLEAGDVGVLEAEARLRNLDGRDMSGEISFEVIPEGGRPLRLAREYRIPGGLELTVPFSVTLPQPRRWSPWRLGEATLHQAVATVTVSGRESVRVSEDFGFRDVQVRPRAEGWEVRVNGSPFFLRGANYQPELRLDRLTSERLQADLELARETNLDALRVHGHVLPEEFYRLADRAGMLVFADFPLTGAYAYHATPEEGRFFEASVREQVPELVELLRNRPSIALWTAHDDPPWIAANASLADVHSVRQNYSIDQEARGLFEKLDPPARPWPAPATSTARSGPAGERGPGRRSPSWSRASSPSTAPRRCPPPAPRSGTTSAAPGRSPTTTRPGSTPASSPSPGPRAASACPPTTSRWPPTSRPARRTRPGSSATRPTSSGCASSSPAGEPSPTSWSIPSRRSGSGSSTTPAIPRQPSPRSGRRWRRPG